MILITPKSRLKMKTHDTPQEEQDAPQEEQEVVPTTAKAKRKPRQLKEEKQPKEIKNNSKVITVLVGHTEYFDANKPLAPRPEDLPNEPSLLDLNNEATPPEVLAPYPKSTAKAKYDAKRLCLHVC